MSGHQNKTVEDTVYFWFAANDTSGSGGDGATPLFDVREAGAAASAAPLLSGTPSLLSHANYPAGCHEIAVAATAANGFTADDTFGVFCTLAIDSQNPSGFVGSCTLTPLAKASAVTTLQTSVDDVPTTAEFEARTLVAAGYFDPAADAVATVTDLTNLPTIPANWLTASGINADAITAAKIAPGAIAKGDQLTGLNDPDAAGTRTALGMTAADMDTQLAAAVTATGFALASEVTAVRMSELDAATAGKMAFVIDALDTLTKATGAGDLAAMKVIIDALTSAGATNLAASATGIIPGAAVAGTLSTTVMTSDLTGFLDDELIGRAVVWTGGVANGQASDITDYASANGTVTFTAITTAPADTDTFVII